jgi:hypothetical protein
MDQPETPTTQAYFNWLEATSKRRRVRGTFSSMTQVRPDFDKQEATRERTEQIRRINGVQDPKQLFRV